jgi:hypothetical protein
VIYTRNQVLTLMSTTTALKVPPIANSNSTATKENSTRKLSGDGNESATSTLTGDNKPKISPEDITTPLELTNYVSVQTSFF